jgi:hypothetical protein
LREIMDILARSAGLQAAVIAGVSELMKLVAEQMHLKSVSEQPVEPRAAIAGPNYSTGVPVSNAIF